MSSLYFLLWYVKNRLSEDIWKNKIRKLKFSFEKFYFEENFLQKQAYPLPIIHFLAIYPLFLSQIIKKILNI